MKTCRAELDFEYRNIYIGVLQYTHRYILIILLKFCRPIYQFWDACEVGDLDNVKSTLEELKKDDKDVNVQDADGKTGLWLAASKGHLPVLEFLVSEGANVDDTDKDGMTGLMMASGYGHLSVCQYLISQNCDVMIQRNGFTALDYAKSYGENEEIVALLEPFL